MKSLVHIDAANKLLDSVDNAIIDRLKNNPEGYEPAPTKKNRDNIYEKHISIIVFL